jgi:hypothetical protein
MSSRRARKRRGDTGGKWLSRTVLILGIGAFAVLVAGYVGVRRYLHSEGFRKLLSEQASRTIGVPGNFKPFRWDGLQVDTAGFEAEGEGPIRQLRADNLHTEISLNGVTKGIWYLNGTHVGRIDVTIDGRSGAPKREEAASPVNEGTAEANKNGWLPSEVSLEGMVIQHLVAKVLLNDGEAALSGSQVKVEPAGAKGAYRATIEGGDVLVPWQGLPAVKLDRVRVRYQEKEVFLTEARAMIGSRGSLNADGDWSGESERYAFSGELRDLDCSELLNETWAKRLTGTAGSTFNVSGGGGTTTQASGKLAIKGGTLTALPFLDTLAAYADTRRFRVLPLSVAQTDWSWREGLIRLDKLVLASEGLVKLEGSLVIEGENLDGHFRLGLAPGSLASIPGAETAVFLPGEGGLLWAPLRITGTINDPKEDLSERLMMAAGVRMLETLPESGLQVLKFTQNVVGETPTKVIEKGVDTIDKGIRAVENAGNVVNEVSGVLGGFLGGPRTPPPTPPVPPVPPIPDPPKEGQALPK